MLDSDGLGSYAFPMRVSCREAAGCAALAIALRRARIGRLLAPVATLLTLAVAGAPAARASEGQQIAGTVTAAVSATPLGGVEVCAQRLWGEQPCATTAPDGHYEVAVPWPEQYVLEFTAPKGSGYVRHTYFDERYTTQEAGKVAVPAGGTATANEGLQPSGSIEGTLTTKGSGAPIAGVEACAGPLVEPIREEPCATTGADGIYRIGELAPLQYKVHFNPGPLNYLPETPMRQYALYPQVALGATTAGVDAELIEGGEIVGHITAAASGKPLAGARACANGFGPSLEDRCATANANGEYVLAGLATSAYHLFFDFERPYLGEAYKEGATVKVVQGTTLTANGALALGGTITGQVRSASTGAVMPEQQVCDDEGTSRFCTSTDSNGEYSLTGIATGEDIVEFLPVEDAYQYRLQYWNGQEVFENANRVKVTAGKTTAGIDARLSARDGVIAGRVSESPGEQPIGHALVCASERATHAQRCVWTGPQGEYALSVRGGEYDVEFSNPDMLEPVFPAQFWDGRALASEAEGVTVQEGVTTSGIDAELTAERPGEQISGTVTDATTHAPVEGIEVCALEAGSETEGEGLFGRCASTDSRGTYVLEGMSSGLYLVEFASPQAGALDYVTQYYDGADRIEEAQLVRVGPGSSDHGIDADLRHGAKIAGTVTDATSAASVAGEEACAFSEEAQTFRCASSGAGGDYTITALPAGAYTVAFFSAPEGPLDYVPQYYKEVSRASEATQVPVAGVATTSGIDARLQLGGRIEGTVSVGPPGRPLSGVVVCALSSPKLAVECGETDASGKYAVIGLPAGSYVVGFDPEAPWSVQYYNGAATYAKAVSVSVTAGHATAGIDALIGLTRGVEPPFPTPPPRPVIPPPVTQGGAVTTTSGSTAAAGGGVLAAGPRSSPPAPHLALRGSHVKRSGRRLLLELSCTGAPCRGRVVLTARVLRVVHGHGRATEVVLGAASFDIAPGHTATIALHLTRAGRARLAARSRRGWRVQLLLALNGEGATVHPVVLG